MDFFNLLSIALVAGFVCVIIYLANQAQRGVETPALMPMLYALVAAVAVSGAGVLLPTDEVATVPSLTGLIVAVIIAALCSLSIWFIASPEARVRLRALLPASAKFDPASPVHLVAVVVTLALAAQTIAQFVLVGGIAGVAETIENTGISLSDTLLTQVLWLLGATLGVGLFIRRDARAALDRLGLRTPTVADVNWGIGVGLAMYGVVLMISILWTMLVTPEQLQEQSAAAQQIGAALNSLPQALVISLLVAVGEEILFRGALLPIFGNLVTSIVFAVLHTQYALTPATLAIIALSLALGWLRQRHSTTAAIIGHFVYNFVQLALAILATSALR